MCVEKALGEVKIEGKPQSLEERLYFLGKNAHKPSLYFSIED